MEIMGVKYWGWNYWFVLPTLFSAHAVGILYSDTYWERRWFFSSDNENISRRDFTRNNWKV